MSFLTFFFFLKGAFIKAIVPNFNSGILGVEKGVQFFILFWSWMRPRRRDQNLSSSFSFLFISLCLCTLEKGVFYWLFFFGGGWGDYIAFLLKDYQLESLSKELFCVCFFRPGPSTQKIRKFSNDFFFKENWQPFGLSS